MAGYFSQFPAIIVGKSGGMGGDQNTYLKIIDK